MVDPTLNSETRQRIELLFPSAEIDHVSRLLIESFGTLPEQSRERLAFAALKCSKGSVERLREAICLYNVDYRDLLVEAGFDEPNVHKKWLPKPRCPLTWRSRPLSWQHQAWLLKDEGHEIRVENERDFLGWSRCQLYINSTLADEREGDGSRFSAVLSGTLSKRDGGNVDVRAKISQGLLGLSLKCKIWMDGVARIPQKLT
jgi:hypothetical protein